MKRTLLNATLIAAMLSVGPAMAQTADPKPAADAATTMPVDKPTFLKMTLSSNEWEIQSSELAKKKASSNDIQQFADMIIKDHTAAAAKLKATLEGSSEALPPPALTPKHETMLQQLGAVGDGAEFDALYLDMQRQAHVEAIALFRSYAGSGEDQALVGFARETLPALETHLAHVEKLTGPK